MKLKIDKQDVEYLHHSRMESFLLEQHDRFELIKTEFTVPNIDELINLVLWNHNTGTLHWTGLEYINALILYQWFAGEGIDAIILWDMAENPTCSYVVWADVEMKYWEGDENG